MDSKNVSSTEKSKLHFTPLLFFIVYQQDKKNARYIILREKNFS